MTNVEKAMADRAIITMIHFMEAASGSLVALWAR
jgi:hypothetical protein